MGDINDFFTDVLVDAVFPVDVGDSFVFDGKIDQGGHFIEFGKDGGSDGFDNELAVECNIDEDVDSVLDMVGVSVDVVWLLEMILYGGMTKISR